MFNSTLQNAQSYANNLIVAVVILLVGLAIGTLVNKLLTRFLKDAHLNLVASRKGWNFDLEKGISSFVAYIIYLITIILFLDQLEIRGLVITLIIIGMVLLLLVTAISGLWEFPSNFKNGLLIRKQEKFKKGRKIILNEIEGTIIKVGFLKIIIKTERGDLLYIPNSLLKK
ncbi:MAG: mechanosensitive ion channel domain-containing protein [Candidatus Woesearchaeota archaeon]|jgi:small-conductance mechanosensitive channel